MESLSIPSYSPPSSENRISPLPTFVLLSPSDLQSTESNISQTNIPQTSSHNSSWSSSPFPSPVPSPSSSPLNSPRDRDPINFVFPTSPISHLGFDTPAYSAPVSGFDHDKALFNSAFDQSSAKSTEQRSSSRDSILLSPKDIQEPLDSHRVQQNEENQDQFYHDLEIRSRCISHFTNESLRAKNGNGSKDFNVFHEREELEHKALFLEQELKRALKVQADQLEELDVLQSDKKSMVGQITQLKKETVLAISERDHFEHKMHGMESRILRLQHEIDELKQERENRVTPESLVQRLRKGDNSWVSECKTFAQKRELLEEALSSLDPEVILTVLLYLKESLSEKLFFQLLKRNSFLLDQYISFLRKERKFSSLAVIYDQLNQHWERDKCMVEKIFCCSSIYEQEEEIQKCMKHFTAQSSSSLFYQNLLLELHVQVVQQIKQTEIQQTQQTQREQETREAKELFELKLPAIMDSFSNMDISFSWQNWTSQLNSLDHIEWIRQRLN